MLSRLRLLIPSATVVRGRFRWPYHGGHGAAGLVSLWRRGRVGPGGRHVRRHSGWVMRVGFWRFGGPHRLSHRGDDGRHDGSAYSARHESGRGLHHRDAGWDNPDSIGSFADRYFRHLYPVLHGCRIHLGHRRHHYSYPDLAVPGRRIRAGRWCAWNNERLAGGGVRAKPTRAHRGCSIAGYMRVLAPAIAPVSARTAGCADCRHRAGRDAAGYATRR